MIGDLIGLGTAIIDKIFPDKQAAAEAKLRLVELQQAGELKDIELHLADVDSARKREMAVKDKMPQVLAVLAVGMFTFCLYAMFSGKVPENITEVAYMLIGTVTSLITMVFGYYFGSSRGSNLKNIMLADIRTAQDKINKNPSSPEK